MFVELMCETISLPTVLLCPHTAKYSHAHKNLLHRAIPSMLESCYLRAKMRRHISLLSVLYLLKFPQEHTEFWALLWGLQYRLANFRVRYLRKAIL